MSDWLSKEAGFSEEERRGIFERDNWTCVYCGHEGEMNELEVDHKIPKSIGGSDIPDNLQTTCTGCNVQKGDKTDSEYRRWREENPDEANTGPS